MRSHEKDVRLASDGRAAVRSHEREVRDGPTELGATGGSKQALGSETRIRRAKLRSRATLGSISAAELAATCEFGREIDTASSDRATECVESHQLEASCDSRRESKVRVRVLVARDP